MHNDCNEAQAERQVDKTAGNFCEYFSFADATPAQAAGREDARAALDRLFGKGNRS